jgi:hypothetical protein
MTGSACYRVWRNSEPSSYTLNHVGLGWDLSGHFIGPAQVHEEVVLDHSNDVEKAT